MEKDDVEHLFIQIEFKRGIFEEDISSPINSFAPTDGEKTRRNQRWKMEGEDKAQFGRGPQRVPKEMFIAV